MIYRLTILTKKKKITSEYYTDEVIKQLKETSFLIVENVIRKKEPLGRNDTRKRISQTIQNPAFVIKNDIGKSLV